MCDCILFFPAAIPVVDPDFNLLPIHFAVDPGEGCSWVDKDACTPVLSESSRLDLLKRYLNLESLSVRSGESEDGKGGQLGRAKAGSCSDLVHSPSIECEDMSQVSLTVPKAVERRPGSVRGKRGGGGGGGGEEESGGGGGGERARALPRSMQNMVRSFGSLGRSFRNRIKNMAKTGKQPSEGQAAKGKTSEAGRKPGRKTPATVDHDHVLCARLQHRRQAFQEDMVRNYLQTALEKFERERKALCASSSMDHSSTSSSWIEVGCINSNCQGLASASTSYLCQSCFERQRQDELGVTSSSSKSLSTPLSVESSRPSAVDPVVGGIERVESGPVLPRYVSPQPLLPPPGAKSSLLNRTSSSVVSSSIPPRAVATTTMTSTGGQALPSFPTSISSSTTSGNGSRSSGISHGDLTLYRSEAPPLAPSNQTHWNNNGPKTTGPLSRPNEDPKRDRSIIQSMTDDVEVLSRKQVDARNFEKELENSLDELQKSVVIDRVVTSCDASRLTGGGASSKSSSSSSVTVDGLKGPRMNHPSVTAAAAAGGVGSHGNSSSHGYICSNGRHD